MLLSKLADNANNLVNFINERILPDYEILEQTGEQYLNDSITVDQMMVEMRDSMENIGGMMRDVAQSNENITNNVQESAQGVTGIVGNTTALVDNMQKHYRRTGSGVQRDQPFIGADGLFSGLDNGVLQDWIVLGLPYGQPFF